jgi:hypothetical protein
MNGDPKRHDLGGTAVAGLGFSAGYQGGIRTVVPHAAPHERSGVLSVLFVVCYLGLKLASVGARVLIVHGGGLTATAGDYTVRPHPRRRGLGRTAVDEPFDKPRPVRPDDRDAHDDPHEGRASTPRLTFLAHLRRSAHPATHHTRPVPHRRNGPPGH